MPYGDGNIVNTVAGSAANGINNLTSVINSLKAPVAAASLIAGFLPTIKTQPIPLPSPVNQMLEQRDNSPTAMPTLGPMESAMVVWIQLNSSLKKHQPPQLFQQ
jgi:hypothetical protein